ncbi:MAG: SusD/RagB family nutrient-binding outer membrane lipoprotein [Bacteroidales bacterium]|nr:SusD/RagB family nutrient-binding outer membrane lipoprotein [Bacteroidales bacterium]
MKKILKTALIFGVMAFTLPACQDWLDVNDNPNVATVGEIDKILTEAQWRLAVALNFQNFIATPLSVFVHHNVVRESPNRYGSPPEEAGIGNSWNWLYVGALRQFNFVRDVALEQENYIYAGIARILGAFTIMTLVDLWGDVPYFEAMQAPDIMFPKVDGGATLYNHAFAMLRQAKQELNNTGTGINRMIPENNDLIFGGDIEQWERLANSLMFRMLNNTKAPNVRSQITDWDGILAEVLAGERFQGTEDDFEFLWTSTQSPQDERNPGFLHSYGVTQHTQYPSPWLWEIMRGHTLFNYPDNPHGGLLDPRWPYYFYRQTAPTDEVDVLLSYRDGGFISIFFGDASMGASSAVTNIATVWGIYPVGGRFDNNSFGSTARTQGLQGAVPQKFYTFADMLFDETEMILAGAMPGGIAAARETFSDAIDAAFARLNRVVAGGPNVPAGGISNAARDAYRDEILDRFDNAATDSERLHLVMLQKWIHNVGNPVEAFTAMRRTGFPVRFNPDNNPRGGGVDPFTLEVRETMGGNPFPLSLWYPRAESDRNPNLIQKPNMRVPIFWQTVDM